MKMKVSLYGKLGDMLGRQISLDRNSTCWTVAELRQELAERYPDAAAELLSPRVRACLNDEIAGDNCVIGPGHEVALLPPVSGG